MLRECIVLGHKVSHVAIEVNLAKVKVIARLPPLNRVRDVRIFYGRPRFYRRFVKDFSKMEKPLSNLLAKEATFEFYNEFLRAVNFLKERLVNSLVVVAPD